MKAALLLVLVMTSTGALSQVNGPYSGPCWHSFHSDSHGRGIESVFAGKDLRGSYNDENCYQLGIMRATETITSYGTSTCREDFKRARSEGLKASGLSAGSPCYNLGHAAGLAALGTGAREERSDLAPLECIASYKKGLADARLKRHEVPSSFSSAELYCYQLGQFEAPLFQ
jgi:hypothetical protein